MVAPSGLPPKKTPCRSGGAVANSPPFNHLGRTMAYAIFKTGGKQYRVETATGSTSKSSMPMWATS